VWWRKHDNIFSCFDTVPACDRQTDGQTDGPAYIYYVLQHSWRILTVKQLHPGITQTLTCRTVRVVQERTLYIIEFTSRSLSQSNILNNEWKCMHQIQDTSYAVQLLDQTSFDGIWNPPVCLLLAFHWQCVRGVLRIRDIQMYIYLLTYLLTALLSLNFIIWTKHFQKYNWCV